MKKALLWALLLPLALALWLVGFVAWLLGTHAGLQFALAQGQQWIQQNTSQTLQVDLSAGSVWRGFLVDQLLYQDGDLLLELKQVEFEADWRGLFTRRVHIKRIKAQSLALQLPPASEDDPPLELPERIDLPVDIALDELALNEIRLDDVTVQNLQGKAKTSNGHLDLENLQLEFEGAAVQTVAKMTLAQPYALDGAIRVLRNFESLALNGNLKVEGDLQRLELVLHATGQDLEKPERNQRLDVQATVRPLDAALIEKVTASAQRFNPQQWIDSAPAALLNAELKLEPNADFTASAGRLVLSNDAPVALQRGGLPLQTLLAEFDVALQEQSPTRATVQVKTLQLADGPKKAGGVSGLLHWQAPPPQADTGKASKLEDGPLALDLQLRAVDASVLADLPKPIALQGHVKASKVGQILRLESVDLKDGSTTVAAQGTVGLAGTMRSQLQLAFEQFNPAAYMPGKNPWFEGRLNGAVGFDGVLMPPKPNAFGLQTPLGNLKAEVRNSRLANAPLSLLAVVDASQNRLDSINLKLDVLGNTLEAQGSYGGLADAVLIDANLSQLKALGKALGMSLDGTLALNGKVRGQGLAASGQVQLQARQLRVGDALQVGRADGQFELGAQADSPWVGALQISRLGAAGEPVPWLQTLDLEINGTRSEHRVLAKFDTGQNRFSDSRPLRGELGALGGLSPFKPKGSALAWRGALNVLNVEGLWWPTRSVSLASPAPLLLAPGLVEMTGFEIRTADGSTFKNALLRVSGQEVRVEGHAPKFLIPRLSPILGTQVSVEPNNLYTTIDWRYVASAEAMDGQVSVRHLSGGLQVLEDSQIEVAIKTFEANLNFNRQAAKLNLNIDATEFGLVTADLRLPVEQDPASKAWRLATALPMRGAVAASFTELKWLGPMISGGVRTSGTGQVAVALGGTVDNPDVKGRLFAMNLNIFQLDQGVRLEDGNVVVDFTTDHAQIDTLEFTVYNRQAPRRQIEELGPLIQGVGTLTAEGRWNLSGQGGEVRVKADRVPLLQRPDRWLMTNATLTVAQPNREGGALRIRGEANALGAYVEMPESGPETLSDDVFIQGRSEAVGAGMPIDFQLQANLGDKFYLNAEGLRTRLKGGMRLVMQEGVGGSGTRRSGRRLSATGTIETVDGIYRAYGQDLTIDRGVVNFQGPLDNPGLNVRAVRKGVAVEAGVEVTGTAQRPKITLVSDPAVPDSEKLSWMIIGRGSNSADRDSTLLLTAAAAIFGDSDESTTRKIAKNLGIDDLSLSTGSLTAADSRAVGSKVAVAPGADASATVIGADDPLLSQRIISLGKRFSNRVYLSFDQSVTTAASILKLNYQYSRRLSFIARTGADNAVDVLYQFSFD
ncbi:translocation/assembly module TamB domain-containing protein [Limnobacter sp.]|uniref:translocation/assembly module TamB domain-containing protein n=1 Tax=Limnobacter sp. TaxID=2003368 RepID=UPI003515E958